MAELSTANLFYVQTQTGIGTAEGVFTTDQLNLFYTLADSDVTATILMTLRAIAADNAKLYDYRIAQASDSLSQVFDHLMKMIDYWDEKAQGVATTQVVFGAMRAVPPPERNRPNDRPSDLA
jgi:hypothetical protein